MHIHLPNMYRKWEPNRGSGWGMGREGWGGGDRDFNRSFPSFLVPSVKTFRMKMKLISDLPVSISLAIDDS